MLLTIEVAIFKQWHDQIKGYLICLLTNHRSWIWFCEISNHLWHRWILLFTKTLNKWETKCLCHVSIEPNIQLQGVCITSAQYLIHCRPTLHQKWVYFYLLLWLTHFSWFLENNTTNVVPTLSDGCCYCCCCCCCWWGMFIWSHPVITVASVVTDFSRNHSATLQFVSENYSYTNINHCL